MTLSIFTDSKIFSEKILGEATEKELVTEMVRDSLLFYYYVENKFENLSCGNS